jgi:hypothetical protein
MRLLEKIYFPISILLLMRENIMAIVRIPLIPHSTSGLLLSSGCT